MPHTRQPSDADSAASSSAGSWTSGASTSDGESTSTMSGRSRKDSVTAGLGGKDALNTPAEEQEEQELSPEERREKADRIIQSLAATPTAFLMQKDNEADPKPKEKDARTPASGYKKQATSEMPPPTSTPRPPITTSPTDIRLRGRQFMMNLGNKENRVTKDSQQPKTPLPRPRTQSSPPALRRSRSAPRPIHIHTVVHSKAPNTAQPRRQTNTEHTIDRPVRSVMEHQPREKSSHLSTPFISIPVPQPTPERRSSPERAPQQTPHKHSGPFPQLPLQTYLHLALASPETPVTAQPAVAPTPTPEMKYPYVSSDSPDLILERITNFFFLPPYLEKVILFGMLACLDSWLYTFTILPLRFFRALGLLVSYWLSATTTFWKGGNRLQKRKPGDKDTVASDSAASTPTTGTSIRERVRKRQRESKISSLRPQHKADILKGAVVIITCFVLMKLDASRMYHSIRGQAAIKLYVIYNVLEVGDRLLSALGQDIFECLCSKDTLERKPNGRSKVWRPFWCFVLAAAYNIIHSTALFYQMVTLNVAVNSYSNALLTLLLSNQFVEIKSTVFKKFEKENLFQITCADIVERFQLWLMLSIIISRNLIELGVRSSSEMFTTPIAGDGLNAMHTPSSSGGMVTPRSFTIFPSWAGQVFGPFLMVLGSETLVDWLKHAYITKFNQIRPKIYETFLDVLCRDYYSYAFADQNLTRRFGLPVIPLSCLFIRASMQTYQMFIATHITVPLPLFSSTTRTSTSTSLQETHKVTSSSSSPAAAALGKFDHILRRALGSSAIPPDPATPSTPSPSWLSYFNARFADDVIAATTLIVFLLGVFFLFLAVKLVLGMAMVGYARRRYVGMKEREKEDVLTGGRRVGGFGLVEVDEGKRKAIYVGDREGEERVRAWEVKAREREVEGVLKIPGKEGKVQGVDLDQVERYSMVAKRIW